MSAGALYEVAAASDQSSSNLHRGNGIPRPRDKPPKIAFRPETVSAETETQPQEPANCGLLGRLREICRFERLRGGAGRTRTSNQTIMSGQLWTRVEPLRPLITLWFEATWSSWPRTSSAMRRSNNLISPESSNARTRSSRPSTRGPPESTRASLTQGVGSRIAPFDLTQKGGIHPGAKFPAPSIKFPARAKKFPAPSSREFSHKQLILLTF
jgi:hypothetical protein